MVSVACPRFINFICNRRDDSAFTPAPLGAASGWPAIASSARQLNLYRALRLEFLTTLEMAKLHLDHTLLTTFRPKGRLSLDHIQHELLTDAKKVLFDVCSVISLLRTTT